MSSAYLKIKKILFKYFAKNLTKQRWNKKWWHTNTSQYYPLSFNLIKVSVSRNILGLLWSFYSHNILSLTDPLREFFLIFDILVFFDRKNWGTNQKGPNCLSFWDSQLASAADLIKSNQNGMTWLYWLSSCLKMTNDLAISV